MSVEPNPQHDMSVSQAYAKMVSDGHINFDTEQGALADRFDALGAQLKSTKPKTGLSAWFQPKTKPTQGLYIWGGVGRGKSFLMDLFYAQLSGVKKRRVHFHEFMDEMHTAIAAFRKSEKGSGDADPIEAVVKPVIASADILCFDEFHVTDITNAMLLGRLFEKLWAANVVVVATSNVAPDLLYEDGLNRQLILPFIAALKTNCEIVALDGETDYRRLKLSGRDIFQFGSSTATQPAMDQLWHDITGGVVAEPGSVASLGRSIAVPAEAMGAARFDFAQLCDVPLGARDYLVVAHQYHSLMIDHIPQFSRDNSNAAKRFIQLVDTLYERGVKLLASFEVQLEDLGADSATAFEFQRCVSRLIEMQSEEYLARGLRDHVTQT